MERGQLEIRSLSRAEVDTLVGWAGEEGWDPGLGDATAFWNSDPAAFLGFDAEGGLGGGASIVACGRSFGFLGLLIVRPELRGRGLGGAFTRELVRRLRDRLDPGAPIALEGVVEMEPFYERLGFVGSHGTARMQVVSAGGSRDPGLVELAAVPFDELLAFDATRFGAQREPFLRGWVEPRGGLALAARDPEGLRGYGVIRPTGLGYKVGPLFAEDPALAATLLSALMEHGKGAVVSLDVPEVNDPGLELAVAHGMSEVFRCIRMNLGDPPPIPWSEIFGVTTLELG